MEREKIIDKAAAYIEKYREAPSMTSHRIARKVMLMVLGEDNGCSEDNSNSVNQNML